MKQTCTALALILAASTSAAEGLDYLSLGLGYSSAEGFGSPASLETLNLNGAFEYQRGQVIFMGYADKLQLNQGSAEATMSRFGARVGYEFTPGALAYVGLGRHEFSGTDFDSVVGGAQYSTEMFDVGLQYLSLENGNREVVNAAAAYRVAPGTEIGAAYQSLQQAPSRDFWSLFGSYENGPLDVSASYHDIGSVNFDMFDLAATYEFGGQFRAMGGVTVLADNFSSVKGLTLGGGYQVAENVWVDAKASRFEGNGNELTNMGLMLTYEFGERSLVVDRAQEVRDDAFGRVGGYYSGLAIASDLGLAF